MSRLQKKRTLLQEKHITSTPLPGKRHGKSHWRRLNRCRQATVCPEAAEEAPGVPSSPPVKEKEAPEIQEAEEGKLTESTPATTAAESEPVVVEESELPDGWAEQVYPQRRRPLTAEQRVQRSIPSDHITG